MDPNSSYNPPILYRGEHSVVPNQVPIYRSIITNQPIPDESVSRNHNSVFQDYAKMISPNFNPATLQNNLPEHSAFGHFSSDAVSNNSSGFKLPVKRKRRQLKMKEKQPKLKKKRSCWVLPKSTKPIWYDTQYPLLDDDDFKAYFHVSRDTFEFLVENLSPILYRASTTFRRSIPVEKRVAVALAYLGAGEDYSTIIEKFSLGKSTVCNSIKQFTEAVCKLLEHRFVKFPHVTEKLKEKSNDFKQLHGLQQCAGVVSACHFVILAPKSDYAYMCKEFKFHSIILFGVTDAKSKFYYMNIGAPGSVHNCDVLKSSSLRKILESDLFDSVSESVYGVETPGYLVGDGTFPLLKHLLVPYDKCINDQQYYFNKFLTENTVFSRPLDKVFARFHILNSKIDGNLDNIRNIIRCCCILHNVCQELDDLIDDAWLNSVKCFYNSGNKSGPFSRMDTPIEAYMFRNSMTNALYLNTHDIHNSQPKF